MHRSRRNAFAAQLHRYGSECSNAAMAPLHARPGARAAAHDAATAAHHAESAEAAYAELVLKTNRDADVSAESLSELLMECAGALSVSASDANAGTADEEAIFGEPPTDLDVFLDEDRWRSEAYWQSAEVRALFASQNDAQAALRIRREHARRRGRRRFPNRRPRQRRRLARRAGSRKTGRHGRSTANSTALARDVVRPSVASRQLRVEGGAAFGTGEHQTTRMCCEWLQETTFPAFYTMCDYGCGSGILALTALRFGAACAVGIDIDPDCVRAAERNRASNGFGENEARFYLPSLDAGGDASSIAYVNKRFTSAPEGVAPFPEGELPCDVVVANILLRPLLALRDTILERVRPGGALAMSGVRVDQVDDVLGAYASSFETAAVDREVDGWVFNRCRGNVVVSAFGFGFFLPFPPPPPTALSPSSRGTSVFCLLVLALRDVP